MNRIYSEMSGDEIPWNLVDPPQLLVDFVEGGGARPCRAIDLGCGVGNYSVWLASRGFDVTGVDISDAAIELARTRAEGAGVSCEFRSADLIAGVDGFEGNYELAFEWEVLHHILPEDREAYLDNVSSLLVTGGKYLSVCFSEKSPAFGGTGKLRRTPIGTELWFSSEEELRSLFEPRFEIIELDTVTVPGKQAPHVAIRSLLSTSE
jgi:SAM-dependent methyltransferase